MHGCVFLCYNTVQSRLTWVPQCILRMTRNTTSALEADLLLQEEDTGSPRGPEWPKDWATGQRSQRGGSRLQATSADAASQKMPAGAEAQHARQGRDVSPADAAVLKDIGLTSGEESSAEAWGSSGEEDTSHLDAAQELDSKNPSSGE